MDKPISGMMIYYYIVCKKKLWYFYNQIQMEDENENVKIGKVFKTCKRYLTHIQNSVFEGEITESQIVKLNAELGKLIRIDLDSVIIFKSRNEK